MSADVARGAGAAPAIEGLVTCVECGAGLEGQPEGGPHWPCAACGRRYPLIGGRIPVLVADPAMYLARLYVQHKHYLRRLGERVGALRAAARSERKRQATLERLARAYELNGALFESFCSQIEGHVLPADVVRAINAPEFVGYTASFEYLERDWCFLREGERELAALRESIEGGVASHAPDRGVALVLGAGTARLAWDLSGRFDRVYAVDASLVMAQQFQGVLDGGLTFQSVHTRSAFRDEDMVKERRARLAPGGHDEGAAARGRARLRYLVGDAARVPLADGSVSVIVSAYFSDVLPLAGFLDEVTRLLKPGGLFLHVGPLEYHFDEVAMHLSAEQFKGAFEERGFAVACEGHVRTDHLAREGVFSHREFDNWVFGAVRPTAARAEAVASLRPDSVLELAGALQFRAFGTLFEGEERTTNVELLLPSGELFTGATFVLDLLRLVDGVRSVDAILARLTERYAFDEADHEAVMAALRGLALRGVVRLRGRR